MFPSSSLTRCQTLGKREPCLSVPSCLGSAFLIHTGLKKLFLVCLRHLCTLSSKYDISNLLPWTRYLSRHRLLIYMKRVSEVGAFKESHSRPPAISHSPSFLFMTWEQDRCTAVFVHYIVPWVMFPFIPLSCISILAGEKKFPTTWLIAFLNFRETL